MPLRRGQYASDGTGRNGAYTQALLQHLRTPDCSIENMFKRVRNTLSAATLQKQISWEHTSTRRRVLLQISALESALTSIRPTP